MQVSLIYTGVDLNAEDHQLLAPEVFGTYDEQSVATLRDAFLRELVLATLDNGVELTNGAWSTRLDATSPTS